MAVLNRSSKPSDMSVQVRLRNLHDRWALGISAGVLKTQATPTLLSLSP